MCYGGSAVTENVQCKQAAKISIKLPASEYKRKMLRFENVMICEWQIIIHNTVCLTGRTLCMVCNDADEHRKELRLDPTVLLYSSGAITILHLLV